MPLPLSDLPSFDCAHALCIPSPSHRLFAEAFEAMGSAAVAASLQTAGAFATA